MVSDASTSVLTFYRSPGVSIVISPPSTTVVSTSLASFSFGDLRGLPAVLAPNLCTQLMKYLESVISLSIADQHARLDVFLDVMEEVIVIGQHTKLR